MNGPVPFTTTDVTKLRIRYRTEYEFAVERNCIEEGALVSRDDIRQAITEMSRSEKRVLRSRLRRRFRKFDDLTTSTRKTYEDPHITLADLPDSITLSNNMVE